MPVITQRPAQLPPGWTWEFTAFIRRPFPVESLEPVAVELPMSRDDLARLGLRSLQFGSGEAVHPSCLNTDLCWLTDGRAVTARGQLYLVDGQSHFVQLDAREPLPLPSGWFEWVYAEHFIEHLTLAEGIGWLKQCRRVMAPGATLRITTPDLRRYVEAYLAGTDEFFSLHRQRIRDFGLPDMDERRAFMLNQIFAFWGHRWIYDADELRHALAEAGFAAETFRVCAFREGRIPAVAALDMEIRNDESIYVEVTA